MNRSSDTRRGRIDDSALPGRSQLTGPQQDRAMAHSREQRFTTLRAVHDLEEALAAAAPGREAAWSERVLEALETLEAALQAQADAADRREGLYADIRQMAPRLEYRVAQLCEQFDSIRQSAASLRRQLRRTPQDPADFADTRHRLASLLTELRHYRARESDLIYEAYDVDIGAGD